MMSRLDPVATIKTALVIGAMLGVALFLQSATYKNLTRLDPVAQHAADKSALYDLIHNPAAPVAAVPSIMNTPYQADIRRRAGLPENATGLEEAVNDAMYKHISQDKFDPLYERAQRMEKALTEAQELEAQHYQVMLWPQANLDQMCKLHPVGKYGCDMYKRDFAAEKPARERKAAEFQKQEQVVMDHLKTAYADFTK